MLKFALIGAAGYVAPKHMRAIKDVGGDLVIACDLNDSVGVLDSFFPDVRFTTNLVEFTQWLWDEQIDYFVVCTPNYEHVTHCLLGLTTGANVICEKPISLHSSDLDILEKAQRGSQLTISPILQMRYALTCPPYYGDKTDINVAYCTPRGDWYHKSWKGSNMLSGGLSMNIGIHLFDWLLYYYGSCTAINIVHSSSVRIMGTLYLERAEASFNLTIARNGMPFRQITIGNVAHDLTCKFNYLHTKSYEAILAGEGFTTEDCRPSIELVERIQKLCRSRIRQ